MVDPDVFAQWTSGQHSTSRNASPKGNRPSLHRGEGDNLEESQPAAQDTSSAGVPMEIGAASGKAKRKKNKPKSKRGLV